MIGIDTLEPEITNNLEMRDNKYEKKSMPMYGIISLIFVLVGGIVLLINFNSISISFATPILIISVITAGEGINADIVRRTAMFGLLLGIVFLVISIWPVIEFATAIFVH